MRKLLLFLFFCTLYSPPIRAQSAGNINAFSTDCGATSSCITSAVPSNIGGVTFKIGGTFTGTLQFEASADPTTVAPGSRVWVALLATPSSSSTAASSATAGGVWQANVAAYTFVRMRASALASGTAVVAINISSASARGGSGGGGGGSVTAVTGSSPIVSSGGTTPDISCPTCNTSASNISGTGTANTITKFTGAQTIGNSLWTDNATSSAYTGTGGVTVPAFTVSGANPFGSFGGSTTVSLFHQVDGTPWGMTWNSATAPAGNYASTYMANNGDFSIVASDDGTNQCSINLQARSAVQHVFIDGSSTNGCRLDSRQIAADNYFTLTNCTQPSGSPFACGSSSAGAFVVNAAATTSVVNTTAVSANSEVIVQFASYLGARLGVTCNTTVALPTVTAITAGTSFTITVPAGPITNPACMTYWIVN